jgi:hypothetical protein
MNTESEISIDISNNNLDNLKECIICLEVIKNNNEIGVYELKCCKNIVHIKCLYDWYTINTNKKKCFICNQYDSLINDICNPVITDSSYIQVVDTNNQQENPVFIISNPTRNIRQKFIIFFVSCIIISIICIFSVLFQKGF